MGMDADCDDFVDLDWVWTRDVNRAAHRAYAERCWNILPRPNRAAWVINFCPRVSAAYRVEI